MSKLLGNAKPSDEALQQMRDRARPNTRQPALLELRTPLWIAHPSLLCVVVRRVIDGTEQRVTFATAAARTVFLRDQRIALKTLRKESRKHFERNLGGEE